MGVCLVCQNYKLCVKIVRHNFSQMTIHYSQNLFRIMIIQAHDKKFKPYISADAINERIKTIWQKK